MGERVIDALLRGHVAGWAPVLAIFILTATFTLFQNRARTSARRILLLSAWVSILSVVGILVASALSVPRLVWRRVSPPPFANAEGDEWQKLRAPFVLTLENGAPELAAPALEGRDSLRLYGLFSGEPLTNYPAVRPGPARPNRPRICPSDSGEDCFAWPTTWPNPSDGPFSHFVWSRESAPRALAYDPETDLVLRQIEGLRPAGSALAMAGNQNDRSPVASTSITTAWAIEQTGDLSFEPPHGGPTVLFVARRMVHHRVESLRVVAVSSGDSFAFSTERASASLHSGPWVLSYIARPLLLGLVMWFPLVTLLLQAAPAIWASRRRKQMLEGTPQSEMPADLASLGSRARQALAERLHGFVILAIGLAVLAPAIVGMVSLSSRFFP